MSDPASTTQTADPAVAEPAPKDVPAQVAASIDPTEVAELRKLLAEVRSEAAENRVKKVAAEKSRQAEEAARIEAQKLAGEFKPAIAALEAQLAEAKAAAAAAGPDADRYRALAARKKSEIEAKLPSLPEWIRPAIGAALKHGEIDDAYEALSKFEAEAASAVGKTPAAKAATVAGAPAHSTPIDAKAMPLSDLRSGLRDEKTRPSILASLGIKPRQSRLDPFGRPT